MAHNLGLVQHGLMPDDYKPFEDLGSGTYEIRIRETSDHDKQLGRVRHKEMLQD